MKGLIKKDCMMIWKGFKVYFICVAVFLVMSVVGVDNYAYSFFPLLLAGAIPSSILSYDERSHWQELSCATPVTRQQIVSAKYILALIMIAAMGCISTLVQLFFGTPYAVTLLPVLFGIGLLTAAVSMPLMFKLGVEKGRVAWYVTLALIGGISGFSFGILPDMANMSMNLINWIVPLACAALFALSWLLAIRFYQKREF